MCDVPLSHINQDQKNEATSIQADQNDLSVDRKWALQTSGDGHKKLAKSKSKYIGATGVVWCGCGVHCGCDMWCVTCLCGVSYGVWCGCWCGDVVWGVVCDVSHGLVCDLWCWCGKAQGLASGVFWCAVIIVWCSMICRVVMWWCWLWWVFCFGVRRGVMFMCVSASMVWFVLWSVISVCWCVWCVVVYWVLQGVESDLECSAASIRYEVWCDPMIQLTGSHAARLNAMLGEWWW